MVPMMPIGTDTMNTRRQSTAARMPPRIRPMNMPEMPATWLMPIAVPRWLEGNASVRIAGALAISIAPPNAWITRKPISHSAPDGPVSGSNGRNSAPSVKIANPALYILTRP